MSTNKQVPEEVPSQDEQLAKLRKILMGHKAFQRRRGSWDFTISQVARQMLKASSPTATLQEWAHFAADTAILVNLLAKFRRDEWTCASDNLLKALQHPGYLLPGENFDHRLDETYPVVFVVFEPEKTIQMFRWLCSRVSHRDEIVALNLGEQVSSTTQKLAEVFPSIKDGYFQEEDTHGRLVAPNRVYVQDILSTFSDLSIAFPDIWEGTQLRVQTCGLRLVADQYSHHLDLGLSGSSSRTTVGSWSVRMGYQWGFFIFGVTQDQILAKFPRKLQAQIGTWQFHVPKILPFNALDVGIHGQDEHEMFRSQHPALVSKGVSHGLGAIIISRMALTWNYQTLTNGVLKEGMKERFILTPH